MANVYLGHLEPEIDYQTIVFALKDFHKPDDKIAGLIHDGDLRRVVKGHYVLGEKYQKPFSRLILANRIYGPSYISQESALSFYGAIPELVTSTTSMTTRRSRTIQTSVGPFVYTHLSSRAYTVGYTHTAIRGDTRIFIASPEKALTDLLLSQREISSVQALVDYLKGLRLDDEFLKSLDISKLVQIATSCRSPIVSYLVRLRSDL